MFTAWQRLIADNYGGGDYAHVQSLAECRDVGDTLFTFLMIETDPKEGCDDWPAALGRLNTARRDIEELDRLMKMHAPYITERQRDRDAAAAKPEA